MPPIGLTEPEARWLQRLRNATCKMRLLQCKGGQGRCGEWIREQAGKRMTHVLQGVFRFIMKSLKKKFCFLGLQGEEHSIALLLLPNFERLKGKPKGSPYHAEGDLLGQEPPSWQIPCSVSPHSPFCFYCIFQVLSGRKHSRTTISGKCKKWSQVEFSQGCQMIKNIRYIGVNNLQNGNQSNTIRKDFWK